ncbi:MAG: hypothetical protein LUD50_02710 [Clostridia bacterium]|nr:hypothetical protein [Clostridia bacterium]
MVVRLNVAGLRATLLGILAPYEIKWDEIKELRYHKAMFPLILVSNKFSFGNKNINRIIFFNNKVIVLPLRKDVYEFIISHTDKPIVDLPDDAIQKMYSKK